MKIKGFNLRLGKIIGGGLALVAATLAVKGANDVVQEGIERCPDEPKDEPKNEEIPAVEDVAEEEAEEVEEAAEPEVLDENMEKVD